jgi:hypothetical protein
MLEVLSNRRRRFAIHFLKRRGRSEVTVSELAERVAGWEYGKDVDRLTHRERKRVRNALRQFHLPKMDDYGFVEYDAQRGRVSLTEEAARTDFYIDSLTGGAVPWGVYYLGLSALGALSLAAVWTGVVPSALLSPLSWGVFFVTALGLSAVGHFYDNYCRMRLGARDTPPEVEQG